MQQQTSRLRIVAFLIAFDLVVLLGLYVYGTVSSRPEASQAAAVTPSPQGAGARAETATSATPTSAETTSTPTPKATVKALAAPGTAVSTPSRVPQPSPSLASTATTQPLPSPIPPTSTPPPAPNSLTAADLLRRVSQQEASLRSGRLSAVLDLGNGERSAAEVLFDLRGAEPRFHSSTTYTGAKESRSLERLTVGSQAWQRRPDGGWDLVREEEGVAGRLRDYLPGAASAEDARLETANSLSATLRWYDSTHDADVTAKIGIGDGVPLVLTRVARGSKSVLTVTYLGWNTAVEIEPPGGG